jgi:hypothetical protein
MPEQIFDDIHAPVVSVAQDGRTLVLELETDKGPITLLLAPDVLDLLTERISNRSGAASRIRFEGEPSFHLPVAQRAIARVVNDAVEMTLYAIVSDHGPVPVPIRAMMTWHVAQTLAHEMTGAALQAESNAGAD